MAGVAHVPYLERRPSGFFFRRRIPAPKGDLNFIHRHALCLSLRTHVLSDAKILARRLTALSDQVFAALSEKVMPIARQDAETLLVELARCELEIFEAARAAAPARSEEAANLAAASESAMQDTLRRALALGDREVARHPLRNVAARLGIALPEDDADWQALAHEATRVLLDVSVERERRHVGLYEGKTMFFRSAVNQADGASRALTVGATHATAPAEMATARSIPATPAAPAAVSVVERPLEASDALSTGSPIQQGASTSANAPAKSTTPSPVPVEEAQVVDGDGDAIQGQAQSAPQNEVAARDESGSILLEEAFDLYIEKKLAGYTEEFDEEEVPTKAAGKRWKKSSGNGLKVARRLWVNLLGNRPILEITSDEIKEAKALLMRLPETHGKSCNETSDLRELVRSTDQEEERAIELAVAKAVAAGGSPAAIERARLDARIPRLRVETILKHVRALNRPAKMLMKLELIERNPFGKHMISNLVADAMRKDEVARDRRPWDDRIYKLFATPVFQGKASGVGDPLFWAPLMSYLGGGREEEVLQLSPDDFEQQDGIAYYHIRPGPGQQVKSPAAIRIVPVHPELIRLGLLELVELRRKEGAPRLFPDLERGRHKETLSEYFTKEFTRYRQRHNVYWRGLDFHALRTTYHHRLMDNRTPGYIKRRLMGHERLDEGEKSYAQGGISLHTLFDVVSEVKVNLSMIKSPFGERAANGTPGLRIVEGGKPAVAQLETAK